MKTNQHVTKRQLIPVLREAADTIVVTIEELEAERLTRYPHAAALLSCWDMPWAMRVRERAARKLATLYRVHGIDVLGVIR